MRLIDRAFCRYRDTVGIGMDALAPSFLIIGAQKSGSTALHSFLRRHPSIFTPPEKELDFFSCNTRYARGSDYYHGYFRFFGVRSGDISFEASPSYLKHEHSAERIHQYDPNIKIICTLRDPVDRSFSAFQMYRRKYLEDKEFFTDWYKECFDSPVEIEPRNATELDSFGTFVKHEIAAHENNRVIDLDILSHGMYYRKLTHYYQLFNRRNILVISARELLTASKRTMKTVGEFLGIDPGLFSVTDGETVFAGGYTSQMTPEERQLLVDYFKPQNEQLFNLIGKSFEWQ